jgi:DNA-binding transcriptional MerR regulator
METPNMIDTVLNNLISSSDAAVLLNCDIRTLRRYRQRGMLERHKVKAKVYYTLDDISKVKIIKDRNTKDAKLDKRVQFLENEVRSLKKQIAMLSAIAGFRSNDITALSIDDVEDIRSKIRSTYTDSISLKDLKVWADDLSRIGSTAIKQIGEELLYSFVQRLIAICDVFKSKNKKSAIEIRDRLHAKMLDFEPSLVQARQV